MSTRMNPNRPVICRVCMGLAAPEASFNIFACTIPDAGCCLAELVALVGGIEIRPDEPADLPKWCCYRCQLDVATAYRMRTLCQESDRKLREALAKEAVESDEVVCKIEVEEAVVESTGCEQDEDWKSEEVAASLNIEDPAIESTGCEKEDEMLVLKIYDKTWKQPTIESPACDKVDEAETDCSEETEPIIQKSEMFEEIPVTDHRCCCSCRTIFDNLEELLEHAKRDHAVEDPPEETQAMKLCRICYKLRSRSQFRSHSRTRLPQTLFRCKTCAALFLSTNAAYGHHLKVHFTTKRCCGINCNAVFDSVEALQLHSKQVHLPEKGPPDPKRPAVCPICFKAFIEYCHLRDHRTRHNKFKCSNCQKDFIGLIALKRHVLTHKEKTPFKCKTCSKEFRNYAEYHQHNLGHRMSNFYCEPCGEQFKLRRNLIQHNMKAHGIKGPYPCDLCPAHFARQYALLAHKRKHHGTKSTNQNQESTMEAESRNLGHRIPNFHCESCGKQFNLRRNLIQHKMKAHGMRGPYACDLCPAHFARHYCLVAHKLKYHEQNQESSMEAKESGSARGVEVEEPKLSRLQEREEEDTDEDEDEN